MLHVPQQEARPAHAGTHAGVHTDVPSPALRLYRRLLPTRLRRAVRRRFAAEQWERLKNRCERPAVLVRALRHRLAGAWLRRSGALGAGRRAVLIRQRTRVALVCEDLTPLRARETNLGLVCDALRDAGVEHFVVRGSGDTAAAVGLSAADRPAAAAALAAMCARAPAYVFLPGGARNRSAVRGSARAWRRAARSRVVRVCCYQTDAAGRIVLGPAYGCDLEIWEPDGDHLLAPRPNLASDRIRWSAQPVEVPGRTFTRLASRYTALPLRTVRSRAEFAEPLPDDICFPVDAVYTWVDGEDPDWQARRAGVRGEPYHPEAANAARYLDRDELRYSLRSLEMYAPWIRHLYLVTDRQVPRWLQRGHPRLTVVDHREIFSDPGVLPTFNSHAIESQLHHIDGLSEYFLYFNDDVFLGSPTTPQHFFYAGGITKFFPSRALLPAGAAGDDDVPVSAAGMNNRALLAARFGSTLTQKMKHTPCALRRSVLYEIEREFADAHRRTAAHRLRCQDDISIPTSLHHYYAFHTGRAVPGSLRYDYIDLSRPGIAPRLNRLLAHRSAHTFCLNDTVSGEDDDEQPQGALVNAFLEAYFPLPSPFETRVPAHRVPYHSAPRTRRNRDGLVPATAAMPVPAAREAG